MTVLNVRYEEQERRGIQNPDYRVWLTVGVLLVLVLNVGLFTWAFMASRLVPTVKLYNLNMVGPTEICPGDTLHYEFNLYISSEGEADLISVMQRAGTEDRGVVSLYTTSTKFRAEEETDIVIVRNAEIPAVYTNVLTDSLERWRSGSYQLRLTGRAAGRSNAGSVLYVPFKILEDCWMKENEQ